MVEEANKIVNRMHLYVFNLGPVTYATFVTLLNVSLFSSLTYHNDDCNACRGNQILLSSHFDRFDTFFTKFNKK